MCLGKGAAFLSGWQEPSPSKNIGENRVNALKRMIVLMGLLSVLGAIPTMAQITNRVTFDATSAFYAENAKMPAGSYTVSQPGPDNSLLLIEDANGSHSVFLEYVVVSSDTPHARSDVTFNKYGKVEF
jgi:hypothetical protein